MALSSFLLKRLLTKHRATYPSEGMIKSDELPVLAGFKTKKVAG
jgi:hypothetical protein